MILKDNNVRGRWSADKSDFARNKIACNIKELKFLLKLVIVLLLDAIRIT